MKIQHVEAFLVEVPQKYPIAPYSSRYRPQSATKSVLVRIEADDGTVGWGETPQRYLGEQFASRASTDALRGQIIGRDPRDISALERPPHQARPHGQPGDWGDYRPADDRDKHCDWTVNPQPAAANRVAGRLIFGLGLVLLLGLSSPATGRSQLTDIRW
jgi:hypothetical protein